MKMYYGVLQRVKQIENKNGIRYATTDSKGYKILKVLLILALIYTFGVNLIIILGAALGGNTALLLNTGISTLVIIAGYIIYIKKLYILGGVLTLAPTVYLALYFKNLLTDTGYTVGVNAKYYWRHLIPLAIIAVCITAMCIIAVRAKARLQKMYNKVTENIYNKYKVNVADGEDIDEAQWEEFLANFDPRDYNSQFVKNEAQSE